MFALLDFIEAKATSLILVAAKRQTTADAPEMNLFAGEACMCEATAFAFTPKTYSDARLLSRFSTWTPHLFIFLPKNVCMLCVCVWKAVFGLHY